MTGAEGGKGTPGRQHAFGGSEGTLLARAPRTKYHSLQLVGGQGARASFCQQGRVEADLSLATFVVGL